MTAPTPTAAASGAALAEAPGVDRARYLDAMRGMATPVSIVATDGPAGRFGLTVSALSSVAADPPMLLVCVNLESPAAEAIRVNGVFSVNVLAEGAAALSDVFAGRQGDQDRFRSGNWSLVPAAIDALPATGAPCLALGEDEAVAVFDCALDRHLDVATHRLCFGRVLAARRGEGRPLLYCDRRYAKIAL